MEELSRVVLITGASRGIGRAIALRLAEQGHRIAVNYNSHKEDAEKVLEEINKLGSSGIIVKANVSILDEVQEMIKTVENSLGNIEILYNNAGIISDSLLMRMKPEDFDKVIDTNLKGTFYCTKLCINNMIKNRWGRVINISSPGSKRVLPSYFAVGVSKSALETITKYMSIEMSEKGISVNAVSPGFIKTKALNAFPEDLSIQELANRNTPAGRSVTGKDVGNVVSMLCGKDAEMIRGQIITVDGGETILFR